MSKHLRAVPALGKLAVLVAAGTLALSACGSDPNTTSPAGSSSGSSSASSSAGALKCPPGKLSAEGSTAQANAISEVISGYNSACGNKATIEYNATGSGAGIKSFYNNLVDFAGSDSALKSVANNGVVETQKAAARCGGNPAWDLPMVVGPIAIAYHVDGVSKLVLNPQVAAAIFDGSIKTWNDPKITALNPGTQLPSAPITVFFRSDDSGTTENFTKYLAGAGKGEWKHAPAKTWAGAGEGKNKSSGVAQGVSSTANSISYMEWSYAKDSKLNIAEVDNGAGPVSLTAQSVASAVGEATVKGTGNDLALSIKYAGTKAGSYPVLLVTYEIVCSKGLDAGKTALLKDFLTYFASSDTQSSLTDLGYAPLPEDLRSKVTTAVAALL